MPFEVCFINNSSSKKGTTQKQNFAMFQLILPYKKLTVECTVLNTNDWQLMKPLFTPSTRGRFALKSLYTVVFQQCHQQPIAKRSLLQLLENRWLLLSVLEDTITSELVTTSMNCLDAISWHKRTTYCLLLLVSKTNLPSYIIFSQLKGLLTLLGVTTVHNKIENSNINRRETLALVQKDQYQLRQVQHTHFGYRLV